MLLGSHVVDISRIWTATLLLAILLPPAVHVARRRGIRQFGLRGLLLCLVAATFACALLKAQLESLLWYFWSGQGRLRYASWEMPIHVTPFEIPALLGICSSLVTWAVTRENPSEHEHD